MSAQVCYQPEPEVLANSPSDVRYPEQRSRGITTMRPFATGSRSAEARSLEQEVEAYATYSEALFTYPSTYQPFNRSHLEPDCQDSNWPPTRCNRKDFWVVDHSTGEMVLEGCNSNRCLRCVGRRTYLTAGALAMASPNFAVLVTQVPVDITEAKVCLTKFVRGLRRQVDFTWAYQVESNPNSDGHHLHALARCSKLDPGLLQACANRAGAGWTFVHPMRRPEGITTLGYAFKTIQRLDRLPSRDAAQAQLDSYLHDNAGRLINASRSFWLDHQGKTTTQRAARRAFIQARRDF